MARAETNLGIDLDAQIISTLINYKTHFNTKFFYGNFNDQCFNVSK